MRAIVTLYRQVCLIWEGTIGQIRGYNSIYWIIAIIFLPDQLESTPIEYEEVESYNDVICDIIDTQIMYQLLDGVN